MEVASQVATRPPFLGPIPNLRPTTILKRKTFSTSREMDFFSERELVAQSGCQPHEWPAMLVKELADNSLDACESSGCAPNIEIEVADGSIKVRDNGPGIPASTLAAACDFSVRASDKAKYISPCRGSQGNALKTIIAAPFVAGGGKAAEVDVSTGGRGYLVTVGVDQILEKPVVSLSNGRAPSVQNGTSVRVGWPDLSWSEACGQTDGFVPLAWQYALLNPHLTLRIMGPAGETTYQATDPNWQKYRPCDPTNAHWYTVADLTSLIAGEMGKNPNRPLRDFVAEFAGLARTAKRKAVLKVAGLERASLSALAPNGEFNTAAIKRLLVAMQAASRPSMPAALGVIGQDHLRHRFSEAGCDMDFFEYRKKLGTVSGMPYVVEVAFAMSGKDRRRQIVGGVNWSPAIDGVPFGELTGKNSLQGLLAEQKCGWNRPVMLAVHLATPKVNWQDRGKSHVDLTGEIGGAMVSCIEKSTADWVKIIKAQERGKKAEARAKKPATSMSLKDAIFRVLPDAINQASDHGRIVFPGRNLYYAARKLIQAYTDRPMPSQGYFDSVVKEWEREHGLIEKMYRDPRGHLVEPHSGNVVPLGTREVTAYELPRWRFNKVLYIEKKGFGPILQSVNLAEKYDMAIMSSEGFAVDAAKMLLSRAEKSGGMTIFCLHDADPAGYHIAHVLRQATLRSEAIDIIDMGLTLGEALDMGLETEEFIRCKGLPNALLEKLDDRESEHFVGEFSGISKGRDAYRCRRVELNALAADPNRFIAFIEDKLKQHGCDKKLVPPPEVIEQEASDELERLCRMKARHEIWKALDLDEIIEEAASKLANQIDPADLSDLQDWASKLKPKSWSAEVSRRIKRRVSRKCKSAAWKRVCNEAISAKGQGRDE
jgi:hypothetical protein